MSLYPYYSSYYSPYWRYYDYPYYSRYYDPYYYDSYYYRTRYYDPVYYPYRGYSSYSAYLDAKYARPTSTVTYSSPTKTEVVTESPGKREGTTYDHSPSTAYTYSSPVRTTTVRYDYDDLYYPRYYTSPRYYRSYSYVSPYTGRLVYY